jgi:hypothetical protein
MILDAVMRHGPCDPALYAIRECVSWHLDVVMWQPGFGVLCGGLTEEGEPGLSPRNKETVDLDMPFFFRGFLLSTKRFDLLHLTDSFLTLLS